MIILTAAAALAVSALLSGTYTNEEQVYFAREADKPAPPWAGIEIGAEGDAYGLRSIDAFGAPGAENQLWRVRERKLDGHDVVTITAGACRRDYAPVTRGLVMVNASGICTAPAATMITEAGIEMRMTDGTILELQRARAFSCWVSIPRKTPKEGKADWWFKSELKLHDRGGRVTATTDEAVPQAFTLRMRNVVGPSGTNAPSLVLYVHDKDPDAAIAYSWADPGAKRVGISLQTVQGSCTLVTPK